MSETAQVDPGFRPRIRVPARSSLLGSASAPALNAAAAGVAFAHLQGLVPAAAAQPGIQPAPAATKPAKSKKKADEDENEDGDNENGDEEDGEEDDDKMDDDENMGRRGKKAAAARQRERARCAAILSHPAAAKNVALAAHLATKTGMSRGAAIEVLAAAPAGPSTLATRMAGVPNAPTQASIPGKPAPAAGQGHNWDKFLAQPKPTRR